MPTQRPTSWWIEVRRMVLVRLAKCKLSGLRKNGDVIRPGGEIAEELYALDDRLNINVGSLKHKRSDCVRVINTFSSSPTARSTADSLASNILAALDAAFP